MTSCSFRLNFATKYVLPSYSSQKIIIQSSKTSNISIICHKIIQVLIIKASQQGNCNYALKHQILGKSKQPLFGKGIHRYGAHWSQVIMKLTLMKLLESSPRISEIESRLAKHTFLSRTSLPGCLDGSVFLSLLHARTYPDRTKHPHFYHWYILMRQFAPSTVRSWVDHRLYYSPDDLLLHDDLSTPTATHSLSSTAHSPNPAHRPPTEEGCRQSLGPSEVIEVQYMIEVLLQDCSQEEAVEQLRGCLEGQRVEIVACGRSQVVQVRCGDSACRQEIVNIISRSVEYANLQVKRCRPVRSSLGQSYP